MIDDISSNQDTMHGRKVNSTVQSVHDSVLCSAHWDCCVSYQCFKDVVSFLGQLSTQDSAGCSQSEQKYLITITSFEITEKLSTCA